MTDTAPSSIRCGKWLLQHNLLAVEDEQTALHRRTALAVQVKSPPQLPCGGILCASSLLVPFLFYFPYSRRNLFLSQGHDFSEPAPWFRILVVVQNGCIHVQGDLAEVIVKSIVFSGRGSDSYAIDIFQAITIIESSFADGGHGAGDDDGGQAVATKESSIADAEYTTGDGDRGQIEASTKSIIVDAGYAVRDGDGDKAVAKIESRLANAGHVFEDDSILATNN